MSNITPSQSNIFKGKYKYLVIFLIYAAIRSWQYCLIEIGYYLFPFNIAAAKVNFYFIQSLSNLGNLLSAWDGQWYLYIAKYGYGHPPPNLPPTMQFAFAPLYPMLIRFLSQILPIEFPLIGVLINFILGFGIVLFLFLIGQSLLNIKSGFLAGLFFIVTPASVFYMANYTEALFLLTTLLTFYFALRSKWLFASLSAMLGSATRIQGVLIIIPLIIEIIYQFRVKGLSIKTPITKIILSTLTLCLIPLGIFLFMLIGNQLTRDPLIIIKSHQYFNRKPISLVSIPLTIGQNVANFSRLPLHSFYQSKLDTLFMIITLLCCFVLIKMRYRPSLIALTIIFTLAPLATGSTMSLIRVLSLSFPLYLLLGDLANKSFLFKYLALTLCVSLMSLFALLYSHWYWIA